MPDPAKIYRIDQQTNTATEVFALGGWASALAVDGHTLWITRTDLQEIVRLDVSP